MPEIDKETVSSELVPTGLEEDSKDIENTEEQKKAVKRCSDWFTIDKDAKATYVTEMDESDKLRLNKHWDLTGPTGAPLRTSAQQAMHPNSVENVVRSLVEGQISEFAQDVEIIDVPREASDDDVARIMTALKQYIADKNHLQTERLDWLRNFFWHGTGIWKHVWDPTWKGGKGPNRWLGEIRWQSRHPRLVFPDARCGKDIHQGRRIHDARYVTREYITEKYSKYASLVQDGVLDTTLLSTEDNDTTVDAQLGQVLLVETWYIGAPLIKDKGERRTDVGLHVVWWAGETNPVYLGHANYLYFDEGEDPRFPFTFRALYPRDNSPWGYSEGFFIKQTQIMMNKTADIIMEAHIHNTLGQTLYKAGALTPKQQNYVKTTGTLAGNWLEVNEPNDIKRVYGSSVPASTQNEMQRLRNSMENEVGRYDVTMGRTPGSITAFKALALLDQRAQIRLRPIDVAIATSYEEAGAFMNQIIPKHYTERRAYRIIGKNDNGDFETKKTGVFKLEEIQKVHFWADGREARLVQKDNEGNVVEKLDLSQFREGPEAPEDMTPEEMEAMGYGDYELYIPEMDVKCRTSATMPSERMFYMEMAKELLSAGVIDLQIFFYVIENGRFPPWNTIGKQVAQRFEQQKAAVASQGAQGTGSGNIPAGSRITITSQVKDPAQVQAMLNTLNGGQGPGVINPEMQAFLDGLTPEEAAALSQAAQANPEAFEALLAKSPEELAAILHPQETQQGPREWRGGAEGGQGQGQVTP